MEPQRSHCVQGDLSVQVPKKGRAADTPSPSLRKACAQGALPLQARDRPHSEGLCSPRSQHVALPDPTAPLGPQDGGCGPNPSTEEVVIEDVGLRGEGQGVRTQAAGSLGTGAPPVRGHTGAAGRGRHPHDLWSRRHPPWRALEAWPPFWGDPRKRSLPLPGDPALQESPCPGQ